MLPVVSTTKWKSTFYYSELEYWIFKRKEQQYGERKFNRKIMEAGYHLKVITDKRFYCPESFEILSKKKNKEKKKVKTVN